MNKISNVKVTALHGIKENTVTVDFLPKKPMSFVYGFNGIGKTTVFNLLTAALNKDFEILQKIQFETIEIKFEDKEIFIFKKDKSLIELKYKDRVISVFDLLKKNEAILIKDAEQVFEKLNHNLTINLLLCDEYYKTTKLNKLKFKENKNIREKECEVFEDVISNPGLTDKYIEINKKTGELEITGKFGKKEYKGLKTDILSQGEKNLLLLYYHLIFEVPKTLDDDSVYIQLIDTLETSLHVDSLITFYDNLCYINDELGRNENFQFVIATHSPAITYNHNELMRGMRRKNNVESK